MQNFVTRCVGYRAIYATSFSVSRKACFLDRKHYRRGSSDMSDKIIIWCIYSIILWPNTFYLVSFEEQQTFLETLKIDWSMQLLLSNLSNLNEKYWLEIWHANTVPIKVRRFECAAESMFNRELRGSEEWLFLLYTILMFAPKMPHKGLKWHTMPCLKIHIPCPALILDVPLTTMQQSGLWSSNWNKNDLKHTITS